MMKRTPAAGLAALLVCGAFGASAQEFAGVAGLRDSLAGLRLATAQLRALPARPARPQTAEPPPHAMGGGQVMSVESLSPDAVPDASAYAVRGVDISHFQGDIAWDLVKLDGLSFVYIKATEGAESVDEKFVDNWAGASSAGLLKGAYHFYNFCKGGAEQAAHFISVVPQDAAALPMTIDLEKSADCKTMPAKDAFRADLAAFVQKVQEAYGHRPVLYVNYAIYAKYLQGENDSYKLWIADTKHVTPSMPDGSAWTMWQYGWHGKLAGIPADVDLDVFNGTPQTLAQLTQPSDVMLASLR